MEILYIIKTINVSFETKTGGHMKLRENEIELLLKTSLFNMVPDSTLLRIVASPYCKVKTFEKGELVYGTRDFSRSLGIVLSGQLRVTKNNADGHAMLMSTLTQGSLFGAAALFNDETEYATDITALTESRIVFMTQVLMQRMIRREPRIAENYIKYLSGRILFLNKKMYFLTAGTAEQRLSSFLLDNVPQGRPCELPMQINKLAGALNISRASLYRAFDALTQSGAVEKSGKTICITDAERLKKYMR